MSLPEHNISGNLDSKSDVSRSLNNNHSSHIENSHQLPNNEDKKFSIPHVTEQHKSFINTYDVHKNFSDKLHPELRMEVATKLGLGGHIYDQRVSKAMKDMEEMILSKDVNRDGRISVSEKNSKGHVWHPGMAELNRKKLERMKIMEDGKIEKKEILEMNRQGKMRGLVNNFLKKWF